MAFTGFNISSGALTIADNATDFDLKLILTNSWHRIVSLQINLNGLQHTFSADLDFLLVVFPGGVGLEFWSDAGGNTDLNGNYAISDAGVSVISDFAISPATLYRPTDYFGFESNSNWAGLPASVTIYHPTPNGTATIDSVFGGRLIASGQWELFVRDDNTGDVGSLASWSLTGTAAIVVRPSDFNGNAVSDILWQHSDGTPGIWTMAGSLNTTSVGVIGASNPGPNWRIEDSADFNGDGKSDILWQNSDGTPGIWFMDGFGVTSSGVAGASNPGPSWQIRGADDFNFDTKADILWQHSDGTPGIWLMDGLNFISGGVVGAASPGVSWHIADTGDFNNDGRADILWQHDDGTPGIWFMNGLNFISGGVAGATNPGPDWQIKGAGDFNFDGMSDILWQHSDGTPGIWLMDGLNIMSAGVVGPGNPGPSWDIQGTGDYNNDAKADILWQHDDGTPGIWFMNGLNFIRGGVAGSSNPGADWHIIA